MMNGETEVDMRDVNINRFLQHQKTEEFKVISSTKAYVEVHDVIHPAQSTSKPRNIKHTPFDQRHSVLDAEMTPSAGIEIPYWFESNTKALKKFDQQLPERHGWGALHWSRMQGAEHLAMRDSVGLMDLSALAIIEVEGLDAAKFMNYVCTNKMNFKVGRVTYLSLIHI